MKKILSVVCILMMTFTLTFSQNSPSEPKDFDDMGKQMAQMQKQLAEQMKKMFGNSGDSDSTQNLGFSFKNMPFGQIDRKSVV